MADNPQTLTAILNALAQNFRPSVVRTINRRSVLLNLVRVVQGAGKNVAWDAEFDGMVSENFADGDDVSSYGSDALAPATLSWGLVRSNFRVGDVASAAAMSSMSPDALVALLGRNVENASTAAASKINKQLYSGTGSGGQILGLDTALRDDNTYATIDRTDPTYETWESNVIDPGVVTDVGLGDIRADITDTIYTASGETPDIAICSPAVYNKIASKFEETRRRNDNVREIQVSTFARPNVMLSASAGVLEFDGCLFFRDKDCTAQTIYYLNSNYVTVEFLPQAVPDPTMGEDSHDFEMSDGFGPIPLGMRFIALGRTGASRKATCQVIVQLKVEKPSACGRRVNVLDA